MTKWENEFGDTFDTEEEARDSISDYITIEDYSVLISLDFRKAFEIILRRCPEEIEDKLSEAEEKFFKDFYYEIGVEDEEDEEDEFVNKHE